MAHQVIFPKNEGTKQGSLPAIVQGSTLETITILALYKDGSSVDLSTMTVTATMTDRDNATTDVTGTLTGANGSFTWAYSAGDIGTAGRFSTIITYTDGVDSWSSEPVDFDIIANPAATAVQNPALVGIPASDAAWVSVSADGGALGTAAYANTGDFLPTAAGIVSVSSGRDLATTDAGKILECDGTFSLNCPDGLDTGFQVALSNVGSGTITITATTTLQSKDSAVTISSQYSMATVYHRGSNVWLLVGDLA